MIDARLIFNKIAPAIFDFTLEQLKNISSIVWLYRGQTDWFIALVAEHLTSAVGVVLDLPLKGFIESAEVVLEAVSAPGSPQGQDSSGALKTVLNGISETIQNITEGARKLSIGAQLTDLKRDESAMAELAEMAQDVIKQIDQYYKQVNVESGSENNGDKRSVRKAIKTLDEARDQLRGSLQSYLTMHGQARWPLTRFPDAELVDVEGLVKLVSQRSLRPMTRV